MIISSFSSCNVLYKMEWKVVTNTMKTKISPSTVIKQNLSMAHDRVE